MTFFIVLKFYHIDVIYLTYLCSYTDGLFHPSMGVEFTKYFSSPSVYHRENQFAFLETSSITWIYCYLMVTSFTVTVTFTCSCHRWIYRDKMLYLKVLMIPRRPMETIVLILLLLCFRLLLLVSVIHNELISKLMVYLLEEFRPIPAAIFTGSLSGWHALPRELLRQYCLALLVFLYQSLPVRLVA